jgi:hypothetical protein
MTSSRDPTWRKPTICNVTPQISQQRWGWGLGWGWGWGNRCNIFFKLLLLLWTDPLRPPILSNQKAYSWFFGRCWKPTGSRWHSAKCRARLRGAKVSTVVQVADSVSTRVRGLTEPPSRHLPDAPGTHRRGRPPPGCSCCKCAWSPCPVDSGSQTTRCYCCWGRGPSGASCSANKKLSFWASRRRPRLARRPVCSAASRRAWAPPSAPRASGAGRRSLPRALPLASPGRARMPPRHTSATAGRGRAGRDGALEVLTSSSLDKSRDPGRGGGGKGCRGLNPLFYQRSSGSPGLCLPGAAPPLGESQRPAAPSRRGFVATFTLETQGRMPQPPPSRTPAAKRKQDVLQQAAVPALGWNWGQNKLYSQAGPTTTQD